MPQGTRNAETSKLCIISNRLPIAIRQSEAGDVVIERSAGGLATALANTHWTPVQYVHRNLPFPQICALLRRADVALVTPLRDGMNLVAKEYVTCQENQPGVLIIGELNMAPGSTPTAPGSSHTNSVTTGRGRSGPFWSVWSSRRRALFSKKKTTLWSGIIA